MTPLSAILQRFGALLAALLVSVSTVAQTFPTRPLRIVVPFAPGGSTDVAAPNSPDEMKHMLRSDFEKWRTIIKERGIKAD